MKKGYSLIVIFFVFVISVFFANAALAYEYTMMEQIPGFPNTTDLPSLIQNLYGFVLGSIGVAALFMITLGGFWYMTSAGNTTRTTTAKAMISDAILGLIVAFLAYLLLFVINPDLVNVNISFKALSTSALNTQSTQTTQQPPGVSCAASTNSAATQGVISCMHGKSGLILGTETSNSGRHVCQPPSRISCHYGGRDCNGVGNAVDYGGPGGAGGGSAYQALVDAASSCGAAIARCEDGNGIKKACSDSSVDHIHATVNASCGCT